MQKEAKSTRRNNRVQSTKESSSKGGSVTLSDSIIRQSHVEKLMKMGFGVTRIAATIINDKKLGTPETISRDIDIIHSRWLDADLEWFHRSSLARIEAKERLLEQMVRLGKLILNLQNTDKEKTLVSAESQLTTVISKIYEIDADFDPEQYIDQRVQDALKNKIERGLSHEIEESTSTVS